MEEMEEKYTNEIRSLNLNERDLKMRMDDMQRENGELRKSLEDEL